MAWFRKFRHLVVERSAGAPSQEAVYSLEEDLGAQLPASFRAFLDVANGGTLDFVVEVPMENGQPEELCFLQIFRVAGPDDEALGTFKGELRAARERFGIPRAVLPIARDGGPSMLFLDLASDPRGRVVAFVQGLPAWTGLRQESAFLELASSFDDYVDMLKVDLEYVIENLSSAKTPAHVSANLEYLDAALPEWRSDDRVAEAVRAARARVGA